MLAIYRVVLAALDLKVQSLELLLITLEAAVAVSI
jgi:hypothetical protein